MFKRFDASNDVSTSTQVKASIQRGIKNQILNDHSQITDDMLDVLIPKKQPLIQYKVGPHMKLYCRRIEHSNSNDEENNNDDDVIRGPSDEPIFYQHRDGPILPTLKLVHHYPTLQFQNVTVDTGAIPFLLGGANVMCPGLTSPGGVMPPDGVQKDEHGFDIPGLKKGDGVVIYAEDKEHALAVGVMTMSSAEIRQKNKDIAIELIHYLGDGLYQTNDI